MAHPDWQWDEMQQVGTDYMDLAEVRAYDERMASFRDVEAENRRLLEVLNLPPGASVLEIGCGTGRFAMAAAAAGLAVTAIDISTLMLDYVRERVEREGVPNVVTRHAGFLTMEFADQSFDAVVSNIALHHLPDAWKLIALCNVARTLKANGQFLLCDVVFSQAKGEPPEAPMRRFAEGMPNMRTETARHVATEYSTYDWIMESLLERAGFRILFTGKPAESIAMYHCQKREWYRDLDESQR